MAEYGAFDVLGPIMIGPSSSHTAGACRIANTAAKICGKNFESVEFLLHGSFAHTYKGHGTDKALVGGIMGYETDDERIKTSFEIAESEGIKFSFKTTDLGENYKDQPDEYVIGTSIGGGAIVIVDINGMEIEFRGEHPTILLQYDEQQGVIAYVSSLLAGNSYNIESINTQKDKLKNLVTELSDDLKNAVLKAERFNATKYVGV